MTRSPEVFELHILPDKAVGADQDVYLPLGEVFEDILYLFGGAGAGKIVDPDGEIFQAVAECVEMLVGQHCGRHQHCHLLAVGGRLERRADGDFCLAETDITAYQAVHRAVALHVGLDIAGGRQLVGGVLIDEGCLKFMLQVAVGREAETLLLLAGGVELDEVAGDVLEFLLGLLFHPGSRPRNRAC